MRLLLSVIFIAAVAWSGFWVFGSRGVQGGLTRWIEERQVEGWVAEVADISTAGFPNRFDTTFTDIHLADPETGLAWTAPFFQLLAQSYRPNHIIALWPDQHSLATPSEKIDMRSDKTQASLLLEPGTDLALEQLILVAEGLDITSDQDWSARFPTANFAVEREEAKPESYRIGLRSEQTRLSGDFITTLAAQGLPEVFETLRLDADVGFDRPWDLRALQDRRPQPTDLELREFRATWGELDLRAAGDLEIDASGFAQGDVRVRAENWREMIALAVSVGAIAPEIGEGMTRALTLLAGLGSDPDILEVPLNFRNGRVNLGPLPLGPAPIFVIR